MSELYCHLNLPKPFVKGEFNREKYSITRHSLFDKDDINVEFLDLIDSFGLALSHAEVFYSQSNSKHEAHIDTHANTDFPKLNWIFGGEGSLMIWYKPKEGYSGTDSYTSINTKYLGFEPRNIIPIEAANLLSPSLVQAAVIHNVQTFTDPRWCLSTVYHYKDTNTFPTFNKLLEIFKDYATHLPTT